MHDRRHQLEYQSPSAARPSSRPFNEVVFAIAVFAAFKAILWGGTSFCFARSDAGLISWIGAFVSVTLASVLLALAVACGYRRRLVFAGVTLIVVAIMLISGASWRGLDAMGF